MKMISSVINLLDLALFAAVGYVLVVHYSLGNLGIAVAYLAGISVKYIVKLSILCAKYESKLSEIMKKMH